MARCRYQLIFSGGFGGLVAYDGKGGRLTKDGAPFDRIHLIRPIDDLGNIGLTLFNAKMTFSSGPFESISPVRSPSRRDRRDTTCIFHYEANPDPRSVAIVGEIPALNLKHGSVLFNGSTAEFDMLWYAGDMTGKLAGIPLQVLVPKFTIHPAILRFFGLSAGIIGVAVAAWDKDQKSATPAEALEILRGRTADGFPVSTQQAVAAVHVFLE